MPADQIENSWFNEKFDIIGWIIYHEDIWLKEKAEWDWCLKNAMLL